MWWERRIAHEEPVQKPSRSSHATSLQFLQILPKELGYKASCWEKPPEGFVKLL
jgi:hypothetical protein